MYIKLLQVFLIIWLFYIVPSSWNPELEVHHEQMILHWFTCLRFSITVHCGISQLLKASSINVGHWCCSPRTDSQEPVFTAVGCKSNYISFLIHEKNKCSINEQVHNGRFFKKYINACQPKGVPCVRYQIFVFWILDYMGICLVIFLNSFSFVCVSSKLFMFYVIRYKLMSNYLGTWTQTKITIFLFILRFVNSHLKPQKKNNNTTAPIDS